MTRLIFINRFFHPDHSATSQILSDLAFHLSASGREVHVVASRQQYDRPDALLPTEDTVAGVRIHRVATTRFGRSWLPGRAVDYLSFYVSVWHRTLTLAGPGDVVVALTDPPLASVPAMRAARRRGARLVNWLQDLYPEVAAALAVPLVAGSLGRGLYAERDRSLGVAAANVVVGEGMAERVRSRGIAAERVRVIANWCDDEMIRPVRHADNPLRQEWELAGKFAVGYSGNLGRAHEFATVLAAAERLADDPRIVFLMIGGGHLEGALRAGVRERRLDAQFRFLPYQDRAALRYSLGAADVHWISLKPALEGLIVPSKLYGIAAAGRPIVAIGAMDGEIARLVERHGCGIAIAPGDAASLAAALRRLATEPERAAAMGERARAMLEGRFTRREAFGRWRAVLDEVAGAPEGRSGNPVVSKN